MREKNGFFCARALMGDVGEHPYTEDFETVQAAELAAIARRRTKLGRDPSAHDLVGLALSGGGIRSASFCLGVLQALDSKKCLDRIDYLSTVSGGGYIGCCLTACTNAASGKPHFNEADGGYGDTAAIRHIRDFSNYLIPRGFGDVVTAIGLIGRGIVANAVLILPFFTFSVFLLSSEVEYEQDFPGKAVGSGFAEKLWHLFPLTIALSAVLAALLAVWAFSKTYKTSTGTIGDDAELTGPFVNAWKFVLGVTAVVGWLELQPIVLRIIANQSPSPLLSSCLLHPDPSACAKAVVATWLKFVTPLLAPAAAAVGFMSRALGRLTSKRKGLRAESFGKLLLAKALLWGAAIVIPSLIWLLYLLATRALMPMSPLKLAGIFGCFLLSLIAIYAIDPNATSLHRLYRDRLGKAFLFDPDKKKIDSEDDRLPFCPRLHEIDSDLCPYPIINAALNIEGSPFANKRGRNADFFEFAPEYVGSEATGWVGSANAEAVEPKLDLATAMAISGTAVSPNMGSATIKPLVPTLALLNVRLGFWLGNPRHLAEPLRFWTRPSAYFYREIVSKITEDSYKVYLTDGGNIENLGVHALLRRRCKLIVAVDAEADPALTFGAYLKLQRYARIDFGALLDLPWQKVRDRALAVNKAVAAKEQPPTDGPHVAIGTIRYGPDEMGTFEIGTLVYIKSSLTGDEADYILDYKARNPYFPHETTGDQFFGEEQLQVYRALGFHVMRHFLQEDVPIAPNYKPGETPDAKTQGLIRNVKSLLGLAATAPPSESHHAA